MSDLRIRLSRRHQAWVYASFGLLFLSGVVWWALGLFPAASEFGDVPHPLRPWMIRAHGGLAMLALILIGTLLPGHSLKAWRANLHRFSGGALLALVGVLTLTGYLLYYSGSDELREACSAVHSWVGVALPLLLAWHALVGLRRSRRIEDAAQSDVERAALSWRPPRRGDRAAPQAAGANAAARR